MDAKIGRIKENIDILTQYTKSFTLSKYICSYGKDSLLFAVRVAEEDL